MMDDVELGQEILDLLRDNTCVTIAVKESRSTP